jgi:dTDP-4-amino-4,6-dideoxy-D-galactose acyltransferase
VPANTNMTQTGAQEAVCTYLEWDSQFFGKRIARLNRNCLDEAGLAAALGWCELNKIDCLYFLAAGNDSRTVSLAEQNAFIQTDVRITLDRSLPENDRANAIDPPVRFAVSEDLPELRKIASGLHHDSRFYFDPHFERGQCDLLYETWIENSCKGFAEAVLVAEADGQPAGYITCHLRRTESQVGLMGIVESHAGKGLGRKLVQAFLAWSIEHGAGRAIVVTQGRNVAAQRFYQRCGFLTSSLQLWYHRWFIDNKGSNRDAAAGAGF